MIGLPLRTRSTRPFLGVVAALSASALLAPVVAATPATAAPASIPAAAFAPVPGPVTEALGTSVVDLVEHDYVEQEYFASGEANRYRGAQADTLSTAEVIDGGHDYTTRLLVRTPEDPRDFNGTVVVEWVNVSTGQDLDITWAESHEYLLREGYAFVALSVQKVGVDHLRQWDPERYGHLSVDADNVDPATGQPIDERSDVLAWDVFSHVGQGLVAPGSADHPLAGLDVERLIGVGESQSAGRLTRYYNAIHPLHGVYDGFVYYDGAGPLRGDLTTPAVSVNTENRALSATAPLPPEGPYVRTWEVAGTSHVSLEGVTYIDAMMLRDESILVDGLPVDLTGLLQGCTNYPLWTPVDTGHVVNAAFDHVNRWITDGTPAPASALFQRETDGITLVRDAGGNVVGGIQLPDYVVPLAENVAINTGPGLCRLAGYHREFTSEELAALYPNHGAYVKQVKKSAAAVVAAGYLLKKDAREIQREAARSRVGR